VRADIVEMLEMLQARLAEVTAQRDRWEPVGMLASVSRPIPLSCMRWYKMPRASSQSDFDGQRLDAGGAQCCPKCPCLARCLHLLHWERAVETCDVTKKIIALCVDAIEEICNDRPTGDLWVRRWASLLALLTRIIHDSTSFFISARCTRAMYLS
jgi:hypothetical protein